MIKLSAITAIGAVAALLFTGCVPITYTKSVTTTRDAQGNITGSTVTETIIEPHQETPKIETLDKKVTLDHLN